MEDGPACTLEQAQSMAEYWDEFSSLRAVASQGKRLMRDAQGKKEVRPSLENISYNFEVLSEMAQKMKGRMRLSADPVEMIAVMFLAWYDKHRVHYKEIEGFDAQAWAFKDAWCVHKIFSKMRPKVIRDEKPREP